MKPVWFIRTDGGPDENPRFDKTIAAAVHTFLRYNLDYYNATTNAPGRSSFIPVERRMASLSRQMSGLILPYDHFGSHLDSSRRTIDDELERRNFMDAALVLSEVFSNVVIDNYPVVSKIVQPESSEIDSLDLYVKDEEWYSRHVRTSQYSLQIAKCHDRKCCTAPRSNFLELFPQRFLPPPEPFAYDEHGDIEPTSPTNKSSRFLGLFQSLHRDDTRRAEEIQMAYDKWCPSITSEMLKKRTCGTCGLYFGTELKKRNHKRTHKKRQSQVEKRTSSRIIARRPGQYLIPSEGDVEWVSEEDFDASGHDLEQFDSPPGPSFAEIEDVTGYFESPWEQTDGRDEN